ncbi:hypothetical protein FKW77_002096 [Venturia effusa]|uniref:Uncharacterized protein n=1 Tax=Venturia effusa TaxID=50376 RepID=A0A517LGN1_9PEZI|nr:hypothetical protein FKW77_002096 [Venturia effusa]
MFVSDLIEVGEGRNDGKSVMDQQTRTGLRASDRMADKQIVHICVTASLFMLHRQMVAGPVPQQEEMIRSSGTVVDYWDDRGEEPWEQRVFKMQDCINGLTTTATADVGHEERMATKAIFITMGKAGAEPLNTDVEHQIRKGLYMVGERVNHSTKADLITGAMPKPMPMAAD